MSFSNDLFYFHLVEPSYKSEEIERNQKILKELFFFNLENEVFDQNQLEDEAVKIQSISPVFPSPKLGEPATMSEKMTSSRPEGYTFGKIQSPMDRL